MRIEFPFEKAFQMHSLKNLSRREAQGYSRKMGPGPWRPIPRGENLAKTIAIEQSKMRQKEREMNLRSLRAKTATAHNASITPQLSVGQVNAICGSADAAAANLIAGHAS